MSILNYFFIGAAFTLIIDLILGMKMMKKHPKIQESLQHGDWNMSSRIICAVIWPISLLVFINAFIKERFKK